MTPNIRVKIENFRAVNKADLIIDGITVVAGENGCGKSSISKLLYFLYKTVSNYDLLVRRKLYFSLSEVAYVLDIVQQDLRGESKDRIVRNELRREIHDLRRELPNSEHLEDELNIWIETINRLETIFNNLKDTPSERFRRNSVRFNYIMRDLLKNDNDEEKAGVSFSRLKELVEDNFKEAIGKIKSRPTSLFTDELQTVFSDSDLPKKFEVLEFDDVIVSLKKKDLSIPYSVQNVVYIDTPMVISIEDSSNIHWEDLKELLVERGSNKTNKFTRIISDEIIQGDVVIEEGNLSTEDFIFKRSDGAEFNLDDVATGIKSFSILQMLLKKGALTDKTLLILDEPESHLHPQWIVEYARIIVKLNKDLGVKFFIATHNPDMVSAIRYISEEEGNLDKVNFYLAQKSKEEFKYDYQYLNKEIDPIFESFNIALDRINQYGVG